MAKQKEKKTPKKQKAAGKAVKKKTAPVKKVSAKPVAKKKAPVKKVIKTAKAVSKPKPVAKSKPVIKPVLKSGKSKFDKRNQSKQYVPPPPVKRAPFVPPVEKPKGTPTQLSMAFEEAKTAISYKPRITRSRSGNLVYQIEYTIRSSPAILYEFLTSSSGLAQWFADSVDINDHRCSFVWEGVEETATIIDSIPDQYIRYKWDNSDDDEYFEFRISKNEITGDTILTITDFAPENEVRDEKMLWDSQVKLLVQQVGG